MLSCTPFLLYTRVHADTQGSGGDLSPRPSRSHVSRDILDIIEQFPLIFAYSDVFLLQWVSVSLETMEIWKKGKQTTIIVACIVRSV